jgi:hypothetical protein
VTARAWRAVSLGAAFGVVVIGKQLYRDATADQLAAVLAPTAHAVAFVTRTPFHATAAGWLDASGTFLIAPACAGVNFALAAFLALCLGWLPRMTGAGSVVRRLAAAAALACDAGRQHGADLDRGVDAPRGVERRRGARARGHRGVPGRAARAVRRGPRHRATEGRCARCLIACGGSRRRSRRTS